MKNVLFVCIENSCRSQIAEAFAGYFGKGIIRAYSAGSRPSGKVNPYAVEVMRELDIDISSYRSKGFGELPLKEFDYVITLGCQDSCPFVTAKKHLEWRIDDPKGKGIEYFRRIRDEIMVKVGELIALVEEGG